jgi:sortase A
VSSGPPAPQPGDGRPVTPIGAHRTSVADLQREVERLTAALHDSEQRRHEAERAVTRLAAATPAPPSRWRRIRGAALLVGLIAGLLIAADGVATIVWQEPISAIVQSRSQATLRSDLGDLQRVFANAERADRAARRRQGAAQAMRRDALTLLHARTPGAALGRLVIPRIGLNEIMVESTSHDALAKGPGHYLGTVLPGLTGTVGIAGHRTTYGAPFRHIDALRPGSRIELDMPYGRFVYRVVGTEITTPDNAASLRSRPGSYRLVLTACHPLYSAAKRIVVTARQVSARSV